MYTIGVSEIAILLCDILTGTTRCVVYIFYILQYWIYAVYILYIIIIKFYLNTF